MTVYYVSPTGNDASSGISPGSAFATLGAAVKAMAGSGTADTTYVLDGTYYLNGKGLSLTGANSNDTITAYQGASPVISGGSAVPSTGWSAGANGTWSIQLNNTSDVEQLTVNGQSQTLARYPNEVPSDPIKGGWLWAQALPAGYNPSNHIAYNPADFPAGQPPSVGEKVSIFDASNWSSNLLTITAVDTTQHVITFGQSSWFNLGAGSRYFVSGAQPLLDQPGEWYFNQATHTLYYRPPAGFDGSGAVVSGETSILNISNAQNVTIHGLSFADAATKAAVDYVTAAAVNINSSTGVVIDGNNFKNVAQAVTLSGSSNHNTISNNTISDTWSAAIRATDGTTQNLITQNSIQNSNTVFATSGSIQLENSSNNTLSHNSIHDVPGAAITDFQKSGSSGANLIEYNTVVNSGLKNNDTGAIYAYAGSNTSALGDTVAYNKVINPGGLGTTSSGFISGDYWGVGIYMDDGTANSQIYGNFISGGTVGGIFLAGGNNNHVWNNIITGTHQAAGGGLGYGILLGSFANTTPMAGTEVHNNIIQVPTGTSAISFQNGIVNPSAIYSNIYYGSSSSALQIANMTLSQFQAKGGDQGSTFTTDPGFTDAANGNYSLHSGSYALSHGFQDLPWAQIDLAGVQDPSQTGLTIPTITAFSTDSGLTGDHITNDNTLTLTGTAEAGSTVKVYDGATLLGSAIVDGSGAWSYTTEALANGVHSLTSVTVDGGGNTSALSTALTVTVDTTTPNAPSIASFSTDTGLSGDRITSDNTLTLTGTAEASSTVKIYDGATLLGSVTANGSGAWSYTTATLANGAHNFTVTATNATGNTGVASSVFNVTIDTTAPVVPSIASFSTDSGVLGDRVTNDNTLTLTGTAEANATVKIYDGTTLLNNVTANSGGAWSYTTPALSNGSHSLTATATDVAGNTGAASTTLVVTVDTSTPTAPIIASLLNDSGVAGDRITNNNTLMLNGTAEANSTVKIYDGATLLGNFTANGSGAWSYTTAALANGDHNLTATATDVAGNTGMASAALVVTIDTTAPVVTQTAAIPSGGIEFPGDTVTVTLTLSETVTITGTPTLSLNNGGTATYTGGSGTNALAFSYTVGPNDATVSALAITAVNLLNGAKINDTAGNSANLSAALVTFTDLQIDPPAPATPAPSIMSFSTDSGAVGDGITKDNTLTLTGGAEANSTVTIYDGELLLGSAKTSSRGVWSYTTLALTDGEHSLTATATVAGNTSAASAVLAVTIDTTAPAIPTVASFSADSGTPGDHITNDNTLTLTGTAEAGATITINDGTKALGSTTVSDSGDWSFTTAALGNGKHNLTAMATDAAGNTSTTLSPTAISLLTATTSTPEVATNLLAVTVDSKAPNAPTIVSFSTDSGTPGDRITNDDTPTLSGKAEANATVSVYDGATYLGSATASATGIWNFTPENALADGSHSLRAVATDVAGNSGVASKPLVITTDATAPDNPVILTFSTDSGTPGDHITNDNTLTLTGTAEASATVKVYDGETLLGSVKASATGGWSYTTKPLDNGEHSLSATATDIAGNTGDASDPLLVSVVVPAILGLTNDSGVVGDHVTNQSALMLSGEAEANATVRIYDGTKLLGSTTSDDGGDWSYTTLALGTGKHSLSATSTDTAGYTSSTSSVFAVTIDKTAPVTPTITLLSDSGTPGDRITNDDTPTLSGKAEANASIKIYDGVTYLGSATAGSSGNWSFTPESALTDGSHSLTATATDGAGNTGVASKPLVITTDTIAPDSPSILLSSTANNTLRLAGTAEANATVKVYDGEVLLGSVKATSAGGWNYTTTRLGNGEHNLSASATDVAGNIGSAPSDNVVVGLGGNNVLGGGAGTDTFVFWGSFGKDTIADFQPSNDVVQFNHSMFVDFAAVLAHSEQAGNDVTITADASNSVTLQNTVLSQLTANHFHIV